MLMISCHISLETKQWPFHLFVNADLSLKYLFMAKWIILFICDWYQLKLDFFGGVASINGQYILTYISSSASSVHWMCHVACSKEACQNPKIRKD